MKTKVVIQSNMSKFISKNQSVMDMALSNAATDIIRLSKMQVPHDTGNLQNTGKIKRLGVMKFEVSYNESGLAPYARRWEFTTPPHGFKKGRKSHYLSDPGDQITRQDNMAKLFIQAANRIGVRL